MKVKYWLGKKKLPKFHLARCNFNVIARKCFYIFQQTRLHTDGSFQSSFFFSDPPTAPTPPDGNIGTTEVSVPFKTKRELNNGKRVR